MLILILRTIRAILILRTIIVVIGIRTQEALELIMVQGIVRVKIEIVILIIVIGIMTATAISIIIITVIAATLLVDSFDIQGPKTGRLAWEVLVSMAGLVLQPP